jgi:hypothetical protein
VPLSSDPAEDGEGVITLHAEEFAIKQFSEEVTVSQPVGPGLTPSIRLFVGRDVSQRASTLSANSRLAQLFASALISSHRP